MLDKILVLDFGSQYTQLIARRIRELNVYSEIMPFNVSIARIRKFNPKGIILSGGPASVYDKDAPRCSKKIFDLGVPVLGICYGMQLIAQLFKGKVGAATRREYGRAELFIDDHSDLFKDLGEKTIVWMSHGDRIDTLPEGFRIIGHTSNSPIAAIGHRDKKIYGLQFHPEVAHTQEGKTILRNFAYHICGCSPEWTMKSFLDHTIGEIRKKVGRHRVICALSGGVDSTVVATLVHRAVGDQLISIFVNNGLLRKGEAEKVVTLFKDILHLNLRYVDASKTFLRKLKGVTDPEKKRKIIGREFIRIFEREAKKIGGVKFLAQGTLYPDVIESVSFRGPSATIKTHHNVGGLPEKMKLRLIEPLRELFKDEVRVLGKELGIPDEILWRHPFPGPGLAVRIVGEVTEERLRILRDADAIVMEEIEKAGLMKDIWQSFAVLLPVKSVGVMGDERSYENVVAIRAVTSLDGMTADWAKLPYDLLGRISSRIINEVQGVNRVVYDISSKPPSTIEWE